ncbi:unnamed protein product [Phytophthora fragariaefolia]|uniref:Unnamed protein product n=1 Tax=Phytophthora fragariaefolia TaxID=1490495 RepID=A0A9W6XZL2_9STRA|nr:unnamed protein product [Phytophthora fragariaefolia]
MQSRREGSTDSTEANRTPHDEPDGSSDGEGISDSDGDSEFEKRMLETWERSYRHPPRPVSRVQLDNKEIHPPSNLENESKSAVAPEMDTLHAHYVGVKY